MVPAVRPAARERVPYCMGGTVSAILRGQGVSSTVVKGGQVRWVSAVDITIAMLASLSLVRMLSRAWTRSRRHRGRL